MIRISHLKIRNFKGVEQKEFAFKGKNSTIFGTNATGKTTVYDAFLWCLFGKDSKGDAQFTIKPQDTDGNALPNLENHVSLTLLVDGVKEVFGRTQREKWITKRGHSEATFHGHEVIYTLDDVAVKKKDFEARVESLISERVFRLLTDPMAFNSLKWAERRAILFELVEDVRLADVARNEKRFEELLEHIQGTGLEKLEQQLKTKIKKTKEEMKLLPSRIDEARHAVPEEVDVDEARTKIEELRQKAAGLRKSGGNVSEATAELQKRQQQLRKELQPLMAKEYAESTEAYNFALDRYENELSKFREAKKARREAVANAEERVQKLEKSLQAKQEEWQTQNTHVNDLRDQWEAVFSQDLPEIDTNDKVCPTCGRTYDASTVAEKKQQAREAQEARQQREADRIVADGKRATEKLESIDDDIKQLKELRSVAHAELQKVRQQQAKNDLVPPEKPDPDRYAASDELKQKIAAKKAEIDQLGEQIDQQSASVQQAQDTAEEKAKAVEAEMEPWQHAIAQHQQRERGLKRLAELEAHHQKLGQDIAAMERKQFKIEELNYKRIELIEQRVNERFDEVRFRMFDPQINEGIKETCVTLVSGVPFPDANHAGKINAGMDIINTLSNHFGVTAPVFIDERESVVNLIETDAQVINLIVDKSYQALTLKTD